MTMLWEAARYAGASARVHALLVRFIPAALWTELLAAPDLDAVFNLLHQSWYAAQLASLSQFNSNGP
ncbi:MAG: hypothetical protein R3C14_37375 [Caldilineaceae bacterium]